VCVRATSTTQVRVSLRRWDSGTKQRCWCVTTSRFKSTISPLSHLHPAPFPLSHAITGTAREMAALLLARLLTRPDMRLALDGFLTWQTDALASSPPAKLQFLLPGVLQVQGTGGRVGLNDGYLLCSRCDSPPLSMQPLSAPPHPHYTNHLP